MNRKINPQAKPLYQLTRIVWFVFYIIEVLLLLRFFLRLLGASEASGFVRFIYDSSNTFAAPFFGLLGNVNVAGAGVFEWASLIAMLVWWLVASLIVHVLLIGRPVSEQEAEEGLRRQEEEM